LSISEYWANRSFFRRYGEQFGELAQAQFGLGQRDAAKATLGGILKGDPEHPQAKELREEINSSRTIG
jgi:hypothetical protein